MKEARFSYKNILLPLSVALLLFFTWYVLAARKVFPESAFPSPQDVWEGFRTEPGLFNHIIASLYRVGIGFAIAVGVGIPVGLLMGLRIYARMALLPAVNFFRNLSPLAWIPFAIIWFKLGDAPAIFLIFMAAVFPIILATMAAVTTIPAVYFRVAEDYEFRGLERLTRVILPAILPEVITALRVTAGLSWVVVVAAEMVAGRDGLGFLIWDARARLLPNVVVVGMIIVGIIGVVLDRLLVQLTRIPSVRWGYER
ncbi:MAG TPA: ABC transporter permease [Chthonomonadaceae bacterium]|nr:ABC transporter permease [Chthonomonadaceae bacterium]